MQPVLEPAQRGDEGVEVQPRALHCLTHLVGLDVMRKRHEAAIYYSKPRECSIRNRLGRGVESQTGGLDTNQLCNSYFLRIHSTFNVQRQGVKEGNQRKIRRTLPTKRHMAEALRAPICVVSWNVLAHPHTRHNSAFHGHAGPETPAQRDTRYAANQALLEASGGDFLCLQEADTAFVSRLAPRYAVLCHAVNRSGEGCAILALRTSGAGVANRAFKLDLGSGKSAVGVELLSAAHIGTDTLPTTPIWLVSLHLQGGPGAAPRQARGEQMAAICAVLARLSPASGAGDLPPAVLCGDWNDAAPELLPVVASKALQVLPTAGPTGLSADFSAAVCIDWVAVSRAADAAAAVVGWPTEGSFDASHRTGSPHGIVSVFHAPANPWRVPGEAGFGASALALLPVGSDHIPLFFGLALHSHVTPH